MASRKRARQREERRGVFWRDVTKRWVVEMRPHNFKKKLNFGSYKAKQEAMVARDYGAHLRYLAGEKAADAGGFDQYHQSIYEFKQSPIIFEAMEELRSRLDEYQRLIPLCQQPKGRLGKESPQKKFCEAARKDIEVAIKQFQASHHLLATSLCTEARRDVPSVGETPCIPLASNPEIRVSPEPTPERESGAVTGHDASIWKDVLETEMSVTILIITGDGFQSSPFKTEVSLLHREQVFRIIGNFIDRERITAALTEATLDNLFFENLPPCLIEPTSIPAIDVPEDDPKT